MRVCTVGDWERCTKSLKPHRINVHRELVNCIENYLHDGRILEVGAQTGVDAEYISRLGYNVISVDYNGEAINMMRQRKINAIIKADGLDLPFADASFDLVYSQGLVEHFIGSELDQLLEEQIRVIRPNGYLLIDVPNLISLNTIPKRILIAFNKWIVPWEREFGAWQLKELGESKGLSFIESYAWGYDPYIGERLRKLGFLLFGERLLSLEKSRGQYFMKAIGALFQKDDS